MPSQYEDLARGALAEITPVATIGDFVDEAGTGDSETGDAAVSLRFETTQPGYRGWLWTVSIAHVDGEEPTVLEAELLPSDGALLAPDWVPWSDRLAEYKASQGATGAADGDADRDAADDDVADGDVDSDDDGDDSDDPDEDDDSADDDLDDEDDDLDDDEDDDLDDDEDDDLDLDDDALGSDVLHGGDLDGVDIDDLDDDLNADPDADPDSDDEPASLER